MKKLELPIVRSAYPEVLETMERGVRVPGELSLFEGSSPGLKQERKMKFPDLKFGG